jgi:hypothetical protein
LKCGKTPDYESGARFSTIPTTEKDLVIDNWKYAKLKAAQIFPLINNLMMINFKFMK